MEGKSSKTLIKMAAFNRIPAKEQEKVRVAEKERIRRLEEEERILETYLRVLNPANSKAARVTDCIELFEMGVEPPLWCFSEEARGRWYNPLSIKPAAPVGVPTGNSAFDALEGGRLRRRPRQTRRKNVKRRRTMRRRSKK